MTPFPASHKAEPWQATGSARTGFLHLHPSLPPDMGKGIMDGILRLHTMCTLSMNGLFITPTFNFFWFRKHGAWYLDTQGALFKGDRFLHSFRTAPPQGGGDSKRQRIRSGNKFRFRDCALFAAYLSILLKYCLKCVSASTLISIHFGL